MRVPHWMAAAAVIAPLTLVPAAAWGDAPAGAPSPATAVPASGDYGAAVEALVAEYDRALQHESRLQAELHSDEARLAADRYVQAQAVASLRAVALDAYVSGSFDASQMPSFSPPVSDAQIAQGEYQGVASARLHEVIDMVRRDQLRTQAAASQLGADLAEVSSSSGELAQARGAAQAAVQEDLLLAQVQGHLASLFGTASAQYLANQQAQERALASEAQNASPPPPLRPTSTAAPGRYLNPLRAVQRLVPSRIDQGVDYTGSGSVYAVGDGTVLSTTCSGWPGGTFIAYRLTDGRAAGLVAYVAEDIEPLVSVGDAVTPATVLGTMYQGPTGIETGWADPSADGMTMAGDDHQFSGSNSTAYGANFSALLASLGAPGGSSSGPPAGSLPPDWPTW